MKRTHLLVTECSRALEDDEMTSRLVERDRTSEKDRGGEVKAFPVAIITYSFRQGLRVSPQSPRNQLIK